MTSILFAHHGCGSGPALLRRLEEEGYTVETAAGGEETLARCRPRAFDLAILEVTLPRRPGPDVCQQLRTHGFEGPIILVTQRADAVDKAIGLRRGADDFLTEPLDPAEVVARVEACLRRSGPDPHVRRFGAMEVDARGARVFRDGRPVAMSPQEFQLLLCLVDHEGVPLSRDELLDRAWGRDAMPTSRTVDVHVAWLRRKLERDPGRPTLIRTVHGVGYLFTGYLPPLAASGLA
jgi:two-component system, OmpR family, alkaline phosphatase synthesis response regulator PhoP